VNRDAAFPFQVKYQIYDAFCSDSVPMFHRYPFYYQGGISGAQFQIGNGWSPA